MTPAERLRAAADRIEGLASGVSSERWEVIGGGEYIAPVGIVVGSPDGVRVADADWIATMSPVIAGPLLEWLRATANQWDDTGAGVTPNLAVSARSLALADAILAN